MGKDKYSTNKKFKDVPKIVTIDKNKIMEIDIENTKIFGNEKESKQWIYNNCKIAANSCTKPIL